MSLIVKKFGGTSVANLNNIKNVAQIIKEALCAGEKLVVVVSARFGVTNDLINQCKSVSNLSTKLERQEYDINISSGEIVTASLLALVLNNMGIQAKSFQGWQIPIETNAKNGAASIANIGLDVINNALKDNITPIVTGFQGINNGNITTLGKGGSDISAALLCAVLEADRCDIYSDVEGVYDADPHIVDNAIKINEIDTTIMLRLSELGAKILHPSAASTALG